MMTTCFLVAAVLIAASDPLPTKEDAPVAPQTYTIVQKPVTVSARLKERQDRLFVFEIGLAGKTTTACFDTTVLDDDIEKAVRYLKQACQVDGDYLLVPSECGGGNAWRCNLDHVFKIHGGEPVFIGDAIADEPQTELLGQRVFLDVYDVLELNDLTCHADAPDFKLILTDRDGHLAVDLDLTWTNNATSYEQNRSALGAFQAKAKLTYEQRREAAAALLFNCALAKYCSHATELEAALKMAKALLPSDALKSLRAELDKVSAGALPDQGEGITYRTVSP